MSREKLKRLIFYSRVHSERREYCDHVFCRPSNFEVWKSFLGITHFQNKFWLDVRLSVGLSVGLSVRHVFHFFGIFSKTAQTISLKFCRCIICANRNTRPPEIFPGKIGKVGKAGKLISNVKRFRSNFAGALYVPIGTRDHPRFSREKSEKPEN